MTVLSSPNLLLIFISVSTKPFNQTPQFFFPSKERACKGAKGRQARALGNREEPILEGLRLLETN